jgi:hypothetical protein
MQKLFKAAMDKDKDRLDHPNAFVSRLPSNLRAQADCAPDDRQG